MKTVDKLVSEWTEEERKKFKDLIEEFQERERRLTEASRVCKDNLNKLTESLIFLLSNSYEIQENNVKLGDELSGIYLNLYNKKTPSS